MGYDQYECPLCFTESGINEHVGDPNGHVCENCILEAAWIRSDGVIPHRVESYIMKDPQKDKKCNHCGTGTYKVFQAALCETHLQLNKAKGTYCYYGCCLCYSKTGNNVFVDVRSAHVCHACLAIAHSDHKIDKSVSASVVDCPMFGPCSCCQNDSTVTYEAWVCVSHIKRETIWRDYRQAEDAEVARMKEGFDCLASLSTGSGGEHKVDRREKTTPAQKKAKRTMVLEVELTAEGISKAIAKLTKKAQEITKT